MSSSAWLAVMTLFVIIGIVWLASYVLNTVVGAVTFLALFFIEPVQSDQLDRINDLLDRVG